MKKVTILLLLLALLSTLTLTACDLVSPKTTTAPTTGGGSGTLKLYGIDPYTLDPALVADVNSGEYVAQIFSGLVKTGR